MRVSKDQLVNGIVSYAEYEVIPKINDKATQIMASIAIKSIRANSKLLDSVFGSSTVKTLLEEDENGTYEIEGLFQSITESVKQYGPFPVEIPPIPFVSPSDKILSFTEADISELKRRIERSA